MQMSRNAKDVLRYAKNSSTLQAIQNPPASRPCRFESGHWYQTFLNAPCSEACGVSVSRCYQWCQSPALSMCLYSVIIFLCGTSANIIKLAFKELTSHILHIRNGCAEVQGSVHIPVIAFLKLIYGQRQSLHD